MLLREYKPDGDITNCMAKPSKKDLIPCVVSIPQSLATIVEILSVESEDTAKLLLENVAKAIYYEEEGLFYSEAKQPSKKEIQFVYELLKAIKPKDMLEALFGSQIIVGHLIGLKKLAQASREDQLIGLKLLKLSSESMERLDKKRNGCNQNISVTYHNNAPSQINTMIAKEPSHDL
jgi:hypothetical protein